MKLPAISTDNRFLGNLYVQCDLGEKMFVSGSNSMEIYTSWLKARGASFLEIEEIYGRVLVIPVSTRVFKKHKDPQ